MFSAHVNLNLLLLYLFFEWYKKHDREIEKNIPLVFGICGNVIGPSIQGIIRQKDTKRLKNRYDCFPEMQLVVIYSEEIIQTFICQINLTKI